MSNVIDLLTTLKGEVMLFVYAAAPIVMIIWGLFDFLRAVIAQDPQEMEQVKQVLKKRFSYFGMIYFFVAIVDWLSSLFVSNM